MVAAAGGPAGEDPDYISWRDKRESVRAMGFEEELEVWLSLATAVGVRKTRLMSPLRSVDGMGAKGRRGLGGLGGSLVRS